MKILLKGGRVINPATQTDEILDILIEGETVSAIGKTIPSTGCDQVFELNGKLWVTPGLVDIHVHFRDPGQSAKETTATGSAAAAAGGFTSVCIMPNTSPVLDSLPTLEYINKAAKDHSKIKIYPVAAATKGLEGLELTAMGSLHANGSVAFTDDGHPIEAANMMMLALKYAHMLNVPIVCHAEDRSLAGAGCMNEGFYSTFLGMPGIPNTAESVMVGRDIELARAVGGHVHFAHISTRESVTLIRKAKAEGLRITAETTPHYLALTDAAVQDYDPDYKMNAPLRAEQDRLALIEAIMDGTIDAIATDHAPHTPDEKSLEFDKAPNGVIGLETSLGVMLTHFYHTGKLTPLQLIRLMSTGPALALNLPAGDLSVGKPADITIIDPDYAWTVDPAKFKSKSRNSCFKGQALQGIAQQVFVNGQSVFCRESDRSAVMQPA